METVSVNKQGLSGFKSSNHLVNKINEAQVSL
jgi:hypothetical protein